MKIENDNEPALNFRCLAIFIGQPLFVLLGEVIDSRTKAISLQDTPAERLGTRFNSTEDNRPKDLLLPQE